MTEQKAIEIFNGTEEVRGTLPEDGNDIEIALMMAEEVLEEIQQYRALGTVEECRKAMEKQRAKVPYIYGDGYSDGALVYDMYECPGCGKSYEIDGEKYKFCPNCGQAIDWSEVEE